MPDPAPTGARPRRRIASVTLAAATLVSGAGLLVVAPGTSSVRAATPTPAPTVTPCPVPLPPPVCPTPTPKPPSPTAKPPPTSPPPPTHTAQPPPTSNPSSSGSPSDSSTFTNPAAFPTPPPPLPSAPGAPPQPPELEVQSIVLSPATIGPVPAGSTVAVQATMEAKRGSDVYSVPHAPVTFSIISSSGQGARVTPTSGAGDDTGTLVINVVTGDQPGDTVVGATSGSATAQLTLHGGGDATSGASSGAGVAVAGPSGSSGVQRPLLIAGLAAISAGLLAGLLARSGRLPGFRKRRRIWGRHTTL